MGNTSEKTFYLKRLHLKLTKLSVIHGSSLVCTLQVRCYVHFQKNY